MSVLLALVTRIDAVWLAASPIASAGGSLPMLFTAVGLTVIVSATIVAVALACGVSALAPASVVVTRRLLRVVVAAPPQSHPDAAGHTRSRAPSRLRPAL